ncbi:MAG: hypothetical protein ACRDY7_04900 [Acidimicrobiia bacterium]
MLLAHVLWEATPAGGTADEATFTRAWQRVQTELLGEFTAVWRELPVGQRRLLASLAEDQPPYSRQSTGPRRWRRAGCDRCPGRAR